MFFFFFVMGVKKKKSIPHSDGVKALQFFMDRRPSSAFTTLTLVQLTELILTPHSFDINDEYTDQMSGVALALK